MVAWKAVSKFSERKYNDGAFFEPFNELEIQFGCQSNRLSFRFKSVLWFGEKFLKKWRVVEFLLCFTFREKFRENKLGSACT